MVFSLFGKSPQKMVAKPTAVPRPKEQAADKAAKSGPETPPPPVAPDVPAAVSAFSDFVFTENASSFLVDSVEDPIDADVEEAAMLYANRQEEAARAVLESAVQAHPYGPGERLWLMLFDLYCLTGQKQAFESLGVEYARSFEKSPPGWVDRSGGQPTADTGSVLSCVEFVGDNPAVFESIRQAIAKGVRVKLDVANVRRFDEAGCAWLLALMQQARRIKRPIELLGPGNLQEMLRSRAVPGSAHDRECWLLYLEFCQSQGLREVFEDAAVDFAVTFEVSPPSWETVPPASPAVAAAKASPDDAYRLSGEIRALRFVDLSGYAETRASVVIDCAELVRIDFVSAGALSNVLTPIHRGGKPVIFRHPNHLVAELFGVVGLDQVASVVFSKQ